VGAGLCATFFLYAARRPWRTLRWLAGVALAAFGLAAWRVLPALAAEHAHAPTVTAASRMMIAGLSALAVGAALWNILSARRKGGADHRLLFLAHSVIVAAALAEAAPALRPLRGGLDLEATTARTAGLALTALAAVAAALTPWWRRRSAALPPPPVAVEELSCDFESPPPRWGGVVPAALVVALLLAGLLSPGGP
jgi:hypothetical protein